MKLRKALLSLLLASAIGLSACGGTDIMEFGKTEEISFSWWGKDVRHSYTIDAVHMFTNMNPDVNVLMEYGEFDAFQKRMDVMFAAHNECDVMQINYDWLFRFSPDGTGFYDLNELSDYIDLSNFTEDQLSYGMINGRLNGISNALNTQTCYYNKSLYDKYGLELPKTWDDLFEAAKVMSPDGVYPTELNRKAAWMMCIAYVEQATGIRCFDQKGKLGFKQDQFRMLLTFYKRLVDEKVTKAISEIDKTDFENGISAGAVCWISDAGYYCDPLIEKGMDIVVGEYLQRPDSLIMGWYAKPTSLYCIKRDVENPETAAKFVDFLLNSEEMAGAQGIEKGIPLSKSMLEVLESNGMLKGIQNTASQKMISTKGIERVSPCLENNTLVSAFDSAAKTIEFEKTDLDAEAEKLFEAAKASELNI
ncbi:MAG: carbohydrate ABC transporter substrate-binding protein [Ruminococcus sp.]|nr:carbohydrate ABC transporter substrate-binding protein [Ruminococcus sp.]